MRFFLPLLLAVLIPFNAAFAAVMVLQHAAQPGHHTHFLDHAHEGDDAVGNIGQDSTADSSQQASDHHHAHVHPVFSLILPTPVGLNLPIATGASLPRIAETFSSAIPLRPERPPRAASIVA
ncbi:MAG: hypothetical protein QMD17_08720 [Rhodocyclaceae bacterium]|nr:hypothetical protein [Rhodocyclaceae bacterium]MDO9601221.1 hypothetical protein [Rhodocyclaceae bacterium]MDP2195035.1 hypothetical protein [Rhodocyclaceae bacterium]